LTEACLYAITVEFQDRIWYFGEPMKTQTRLATDFAGLSLNNPVFTASGTSGYADELGDFIDVMDLGGIVTKSISLKPRKGNAIPRIVETDAGMLNAIGLANMGIERFLDEKVPILDRMAAAGVAVFANVVGATIDEYVGVTERLAQESCFAGLELNISCPNVKKGGICFGTDPDGITEITRQVKAAAGDKVLMVKLTPTVTDITATAQAAVEGGADALSLVNTFTAMVIDIETRKPVLANRTGGLSGPAIRPMAVYLVSRVYREVTRDAGIPIMGLGGIRNTADALEFIIAGASVIATGTANFTDPSCTAHIAQGLSDYCDRHGLDSIGDLVGSLQ
jgi:dihydroorotate dehydrogenase (NAD+) catalytic subunit